MKVQVQVNNDKLNIILNFSINSFIKQTFYLFLDISLIKIEYIRV